MSGKTAALTRIAARAAVFFFVVALGLSAPPARAAELAILRNGFSIRHEHHVVMGETTRLFLSADDSSFTDVATADITGFEKDLTLPAAPAQQFSSAHPEGPRFEKRDTSGIPASKHPQVNLNEVVNSASAAYHLDPDLVNSVIHAESGFNSHAVSRKGARGLMQLMPSTADELGVNDPFDSEANVGGGSRYLRELLERYNFDLVKALAAYNAGPERVDRYNGVPPFYETRAYVARIVRDYNRKKIAEEKATAQAVRSTKQSASKAVHLRSRKSAPTAAPAAPHAPKVPATSATQIAASPASAAAPR